MSTQRDSHKATHSADSEVVVDSQKAAGTQESAQAGVASADERRAIFDWTQVGKHLVFASTMGVVGAFASIVLCLVVLLVRGWFTQAHWLIWMLPIAGIAQLALYQSWKLPLSLTTDSVIIRMRAGKPVHAALAPGILLSTAMTLLAGGSVGKEAGALQMGASLGTTIGTPFKLHNVLRSPDYDDTEDINRYIASTGMAAVFSALFFAPLGSCMLVLELMRFSQLQYVVAMLIACFISYCIARHFGIGDVISTVPIPDFSGRIAGVCIVVGIVAAMMGSLFSVAIRLFQEATVRIRNNYYLWVIIGGLVYALLVTIFDWWKFTGSGGEQLNAVLHVPDVSWDFAIKILLTLICLGMWFKGGEIMPSLCIGGLLGGACFSLTGISPLFGTALGSICFLVAFNRCPVAGVLLGCEIFGWAMAPYLLISVFIAFLFGYPVGIYGANVDVLVRFGWSRFYQSIRSNVVRNELRDDAGFDDLAVAANEAVSHVAQSVEQTIETDEQLEHRKQTFWERLHSRTTHLL